MQELLKEVISRATYLLPVLVAALFIGEHIAKLLRFPELRARLGGVIFSLNKKLNRTTRSTATRLYRGIVALLMLMLPAIALGFLLMRPNPQLQIVSTLLLVALFGEAFRTASLFKTWRAAKRGMLTLQSTAPHYLFADTHALIRYTILSAATRYAIVMVGGSIFYLLADLPGLLAYLTLASAAHYYAPEYATNRAFGWAAGSLFTLIDALPRLLACTFLWLAALFTPLTTPFAALRKPSSHFYGWLALLLDLSFGGPVPGPNGEASLPWLGTGTPKAQPRDLSRSLQLLAIASLLWVLLLGSSFYLLPFVK